MTSAMTQKRSIRYSNEAEYRTAFIHHVLKAGHA